jgi:hypothetical protein
LDRFTYTQQGDRRVTTTRVKNKRKRRQRRQKLRDLRRRLAATKDMSARRKLIAKIHRISPRAEVPEP